jgi:ribose 5-phosphate isomerase A
MDWVEKARQASASASVRLVTNNTVIGLGSGRTVSSVIKELGARVRKERLNISVVPTSVQTEILCSKNGLKFTNLVEHSELDLAIDGADQLELRTLDMIKGAGGALTREKIVACASKKYAIVIDEKKVVRQGLYGKVPVEVVPFGTGLVVRKIIQIRGRPILRESAGKLGPVVTDNGNYIIDADFGKIDDPNKLNKKLKSFSGVVETGLFLGLADVVYIGKRDGTVKTMRKTWTES